MIPFFSLFFHLFSDMPFKRCVHGRRVSGAIMIDALVQEKASNVTRVFEQQEKTGEC